MAGGAGAPPGAGEPAPAAPPGLVWVGGLPLSLGEGVGSGEAAEALARLGAPPEPRGDAPARGLLSGLRAALTPPQQAAGDPAGAAGGGAAATEALELCTPPVESPVGGELDIADVLSGCGSPLHLGAVQGGDPQGGLNDSVTSASTATATSPTPGGEGPALFARKSTGALVVGGSVEVPSHVAVQLTEDELLYAAFQRRRRTRPPPPAEPVLKCANCSRFDAVCSKCHARQRKAGRARRAALRQSYPGWAPRQQMAAVFAAAARGDEDDIDTMLACGADANWSAHWRRRAPDGTDADELGAVPGVTVLHVACAGGRVDVARLLLGSGARARRDGAGRWPQDLAPDADVRHDLELLLDELSSEGAAARAVAAAEELTQRGPPEEAAEAWREVVLRYPCRDAAVIGAARCALSRGLPAECIELCRKALAAADAGALRWVEVGRADAEALLAEARSAWHCEAHGDAGAAGSLLKRCGCVVAPPGWRLPLLRLLRLPPAFLHGVLSYLPLGSLVCTWAALWRVQWLRAAADQLAPQAAAADGGAVGALFAGGGQWDESLRAAIGQHFHATWPAGSGRLQSCAVAAYRPEGARGAGRYAVRVWVELQYEEQLSAAARVRRLLGIAPQPSQARQRSQTNCAPPPPQQQGQQQGGESVEPRVLTFAVPLNSAASAAAAVACLVPATDPRGAPVVRLDSPPRGSPLAEAGVLPGRLLSVDGTPVWTLQAAAARLRQAPLGQEGRRCVLRVYVELPQPCAAEVLSEGAESGRGTVRGLRDAPGGGALLYVELPPPHGLRWVRSSGVALCPAAPAAPAPAPAGSAAERVCRQRRDSLLLAAEATRAWGEPQGEPQGSAVRREERLLLCSLRAAPGGLPPLSPPVWSVRVLAE